MKTKDKKLKLQAGCTKHLASTGVEYSAAHAVEMFGIELPQTKAKAIGPCVS